MYFAPFPRLRYLCADKSPTVIDPEPTPSARNAALDLINAELPPDHAVTFHSSISKAQDPTFSPLIEKEIDRIAQQLPREGGIDLSRYEEPEAPPSHDLHAPEELEAWRHTLRKAYTSSEYLAGRLTNLGLLETFGKNAWLVGNDQLAEVLKRLDKELEQTWQQSELVQQARRVGQEGVKGELEALDQSWKKELGRLIETEIAAEELRSKILDRRRHAVSRGA